MISVAGVFSVTARCLGYDVASTTDVLVNAGETTSVDFSLVSIAIPPVVSNVETDLTYPPAVGTAVPIDFAVNSQSSTYSRWYARSGIGSASPGRWQMLADWTMNKTAHTWSPDSESCYVVLAHVGETANSDDFHQVGMTIETQGNSADPILITEITVNMSNPQPSGIPITINSTATGGSGQLYYKYFYRLENGTWIEIGSWRTDGSMTWTPPQEGYYTIVVHVSDDNTAPSNPLNQAGMTCIIGE
jgi:hypothetical protein